MLKARKRIICLMPISKVFFITNRIPLHDEQSPTWCTYNIIDIYLPKLHGKFDFRAGQNKSKRFVQFKQRKHKRNIGTTFVHGREMDKKLDLFCKLTFSRSSKLIFKAIKNALIISFLGNTSRRQLV